MINETHLQGIIQKQKNTIAFLEKELARLNFEIANNKANDNIKVVDPIFLNPINK
jgi:hypothetical protein